MVSSFCLYVFRIHCKMVNAADRISELPNALILQILSLLPRKDAISTSVLSKQWQSLWKMMPKLEFCFFKDDKSREFENFSINVFKVLLSHMALVLQSLRLNINVRLDTTDTSINNAKCTRMFIRIALARNVRELVILNSFSSWFRFPKSFYKSQTLENLQLTSIGFIEVPCSSSWCLNSLTTLQLNHVEFKDEESFVKFLSGCPNLENLMMCKPSQSNVKTFTIAVPSLQRLTIYDCSCDDDEWRRGYVINAPCLKYLKIHVATYHIGFFLIENVPYNKLVEANLIVNFEITNEKLLQSLSTSVKRLSLKLSPSSIKFSIGGSIFYQLVYLELHTNEVAWWNLLSLMVDTSPKLQVLKLIDRMCGGEKDLLEYGKWNQPKNVPECLLTFIWEGYRWKRQDENKVAKYILSNTKRLKSATFFYSIFMDLKERVEMVEDLNSVVRASNSCQLLFC